MTNIINSYRISVYDGRQCTLNVSSQFDAAYVEELMHHAIKIVFEVAYTDYMIIYNLLLRLEYYLSKKNMLRFEIKKNVKDSKKSLRDVMSLMERNSNYDYIFEYSNQMYDMAENDINKLRDMIAAKLNRCGCSQPGLSANTIVVQNMMLFAKDSFEHIFNFYKKEEGVDLKACFGDFYPKAAVKGIDNILTLVMGDDIKRYDKSIVEDKEIKKVFGRIVSKIYNQKNMKQANRNAYDNMPEDYKDKFLVNEDGNIERKKA